MDILKNQRISLVWNVILDAPCVKTLQKIVFLVLMTHLEKIHLNVTVNKGIFSLKISLNAWSVTISVRVARMILLV
jgi:hypothetical protein